MAPGHECRRAECAWVGGIYKTRRFEIISLIVPYGSEGKAPRAFNMVLLVSGRRVTQFRPL
jgi:hypothetical protein